MKQTEKVTDAESRRMAVKKTKKYYEPLESTWTDQSETQTIPIIPRYSTPIPTFFLRNRTYFLHSPSTARARYF